MPSNIEVYRNEKFLFAEGTTCDRERCVMHFLQEKAAGDVIAYVIDLNSHCQCGIRYRNHESIALAFGSADD